MTATVLDRMARPRLTDLRLLLPAAGGWIAAALVVGAPDWRIPVAAWALAGVATAGALARRRLAVPALVLAAVALVSTSIVVQAPLRAPPELVAADASGALVTVVAEVTEAGEPLEAVVGGAPVLVFADRDPQAHGTAPRIGELVTVRAEVEAAEAGERIRFLLFAAGPLEPAGPAPPLVAWADGLRVAFAELASGLAGDGAALLPGLAIGDTSAVGEELDAAMKASSLTHLTAVSGANCAIVVGLVLLAGARAGMPRGVRVAAASAVLILFVVLVTPQPSVQRAAVMALLGLLAVARGVPLRGPPILCVAVLGLLLFDPWLAREYGFALSVLATGGLLLLAPPIAALLGRALPESLAAVIAVPVAAQVACQPVLLLLDPGIPTYGVVANLLAVPAAPVATVAGLVACLLAAPLPPIAWLFACLAWLPSTWIAGIATLTASLPGARLPWPEGAPGVLLLLVLTALGVAAVTRWRWRVPAAIALGVAAVLVVSAGVGLRAGVLLHRPHDWRIAGCDVGQGDAFLVRSGGAVALIDTGPEPEPLRACVTELGIDRIDLLVLTHFDLDHVGGASAVVGAVDRVLTGPVGGPDDAALLGALAASGAAVEAVTAGAWGMLGELRWRILWPPPRGAPEPGNDASVAIEFTPAGQCRAGCLSATFLGDLGEEAQARMLSLSRPAPVQVVKVSHHGSADQAEALYHRLAARVGLIGVGADNGYGHPTSRLLDLLAGSGTTALRTDEHGMLLLAFDDALRLTAWTERAPPEPSVGAGAVVGGG